MDAVQISPLSVLTSAPWTSSSWKAWNSVLEPSHSTNRKRGLALKIDSKKQRCVVAAVAQSRRTHLNVRCLEDPTGAAATDEQVADSREQWGRQISSRRRLFIALPLLTSATTLLASPSWADITVDNRAPVGNSLLRTFGIGDPDIYYPRFFEGLWNCYSTLIAVETPQGEDKVDIQNVELARNRLGYTTIYQARFVPFEGYVVCDRLFTTVSLVEAIIGKNTIEHGTWNPRQPNRLELVLKGGTKVENTVTKRSSGMFSPYEFESAEFSKQVNVTVDNSRLQKIHYEVFDNISMADGPPTVKASQNLTRYQWDSTLDEVSKIEAIQKISMFAVPKEGQDFEGMEMFNTTSPVTIYKYRISFGRQQL